MSWTLTSVALVLLTFLAPLALAWTLLRLLSRNGPVREKRDPASGGEPKPSDWQRHRPR